MAKKESKSKKVLVVGDAGAGVTEKITKAGLEVFKTEAPKERGIQIKEAVPEEKKETKQIPRTILEIFVYGTDDAKPRLKRMVDELQRQLNALKKRKHYVRVLWYADAGQKSVEEKIEWFHNESRCKYFVIVHDEKKISKKYVQDLLDKIRTFESSFKSLKNLGIGIAKKPS